MNAQVVFSIVLFGALALVGVLLVLSLFGRDPDRTPQANLGCGVPQVFAGSWYTSIEHRAAAKLDHPGIVPIYEVGQHEGQHYFSMGFVEGQSLAEKLAEGPLPPKEAADLTLKLAQAIAYAPARGNPPKHSPTQQTHNLTKQDAQSKQ